MSLKLLHTKRELAAYRQALYKTAKTVGFVPTMGALHKGHLALIHSALKENEVVLVSIFVNPTQFAPYEDFDAYPRDLKRDLHLIENLFITFNASQSTANKKRVAVFAPKPAELRLPPHSVRVVDPLLEKLYCGKSRPHFFEAVLTVVLRLFALTQPNRAYFGKKDYQQFFLIKRMAAALELTFSGKPLLVKGVATVREKNGLALSSRNSYLSPSEQKKASLLYTSLKAVKKKFHLKTGANAWRAAQLRELFQKKLRLESSFNFEYFHVVSRSTLLEVTEPRPGQVLFLAAAYYKKVRLIDNLTA